MASKNSKSLRIAALYPELLNIYADRGNLMMLQRRCQWRGINCEITAISFQDEIEPCKYNLFYIGGGQDRDQRLCAQDLYENKRTNLKAATDSGAVLLAVCGGFQLLGNYYEIGAEKIPGIGLADFHTVRSDEARLVGNIAIQPCIQGISKVLVGFENHAGRTVLGPAVTPLGKVIVGHGNNGKDGSEGVWEKNIFATYLHGPLLPKNTWFADFLISRALDLPNLTELDDTLEELAHQNAYDVAKSEGA